MADLNLEQSAKNQISEHFLLTSLVDNFQIILHD